MEENTQLPVEVVKQIDSDANDYLGTKEVEFSQRSFNAYTAGATAYAIKLHQAQQENAKLKAMAEGWRPLLEEVLSKHNTGKLPDHHIYEKIKKFLYGE